MQSRHDVTHPLAMISMISSLICTYPEKIDHSRLVKLRGQMAQELEELSAALSQHRVALDTSELVSLIGDFDTPQDLDRQARALEAEALRLIEVFMQADVT